MRNIRPVKVFFLLPFILFACGDTSNKKSCIYLDDPGYETLDNSGEYACEYDKFRVRWGFASFDETEPPFRTCPFDSSYKTIRATTDEKDSVLLEFNPVTKINDLRAIDASFMLTELDNFSHLAVFAAYRPPLQEDRNPSYAYGRIGADVFHDPFGLDPDRLVIQFDNSGNSLWRNTNLHGWVPLPEDLKQNHWYRISAQINRMSDDSLVVTGVLRDLEKEGAIIAKTEMHFPSFTTPPWYSEPETSPAIGLMDINPKLNIDAYLADIYFGSTC